MVGIGEEGGEGEDEAGNGPISSGARGITCNPAPLKMGHTFTRILPWAHPKISTAGEKWDKNNAGKCWICDRWTEVKFCIEVNDIEWVGGETIEGGNQIVEAQICTNFDSWKFETMSKGDRKGEVRGEGGGGVTLMAFVCVLVFCSWPNKIIRFSRRRRRW